MIYFLHIHKSAGSFVCKQAFRNQLAADYKRNCNVRDDQRCCSSENGSGKKPRVRVAGEERDRDHHATNDHDHDHDHPTTSTTHHHNETEDDAARASSSSTSFSDTFSARRQIAFARTAPYDLVAAEKELPEILLPDHYDYVVSLRNSRDRYASHWNHLMRAAVAVAVPAPNEPQRNKRQRKQQRRQQQLQLQQRRQRAITRGKRRQRRHNDNDNDNYSLDETKNEWSLSNFLSWTQKFLPLQPQNQRIIAEYNDNNDDNDNDNNYKMDSVVVAAANSNTSNATNDATPRFWPHNRRIPYDPDDPGHYRWMVRHPADGSFHPVGNYTKWVQGQPDNYNLRMICGTRCATVPKYRIPKDLFEHALERLWVDFSHLLFVEDMEESFGRFAHAYGWKTTTNHNDTSTGTGTGTGHRHSNSKTPSHPHKSTPTNPFVSSINTNANANANANATSEWWDPYVSVLDDALYEFAKRKHRFASANHTANIGIDNNNDNDNAIRKNSSSSSSRTTTTTTTRPVWNKEYKPFENQALVDEYFREGPSRNCTNPCCGYCSKW